jgi:thiamine-phosphate pyrophosphorylase
MIKSFPYRLYLVTDEALCLGRDFFWVVEEAIKGGVDLVQLREKNLGMEAFIQKAIRLKEICEKYRVPLIINDSVSVAQAVNADGLHIGQNDSSIFSAKKILGIDYPIGLSLEKKEELYQAQAKEAWYFGISPIYSTPTKTDTFFEWGLQGLADMRRSTDKKLIAIGRVKESNAAEIISHGANCLAVVSGICSASAPAKAAEALRIEIEKGLKQQLW